MEIKYNCEFNPKTVADSVRKSCLVQNLCSSDYTSSALIKKAELILLFLQRHHNNLDSQLLSLEYSWRVIKNKTVKGELRGLIERMSRVDKGISPE